MDTSWDEATWVDYPVFRRLSLGRTVLWLALSTRRTVVLTVFAGRLVQILAGSLVEGHTLDRLAISRLTLLSLGRRRQGSALYWLRRNNALGTGNGVGGRVGLGLGGLEGALERLRPELDGRPGRRRSTFLGICAWFSSEKTSLLVMMFIQVFA